MNMTSNRQEACSTWARHLAAGDAELVEELQFAPELRAGNFAAQQLAVSARWSRPLAGSLVQEFDAEMPHAQRQHPRDVLRPGLRPRIKDRVAAAGVRLDRVLGSDAVAQLHVVLVAGPAAIRCSPCRWKGTRKRCNAPCETWACAGEW